MTQMLSYIPNGPSTLNGLAILGLLFLNGLAFASGLQSVYFIVFQAVLIAKAFLRTELSRLLDVIYIPIFIYDIIHILGIYVTQVHPIRTRIPSTWSQSLGLKYYDVDITPVPLMGVTICLSWAFSIILFILLSFRKRNEDLRALLGVDRSYLPSSSSESSHARPVRETAFWRVFRRLVRHWGWRVCVVALLAIPLFLPSFFSVFLLFTVCVASVVPQAYLEKYLFIPGVTVYLITITAAQYIYNIPNVGSGCSPGEQTPGCAIGLRVYDYTWFQIGLQTLAGVLLAVNWSYYAPQFKSSLTLTSSSPSSSSSSSSSKRKVHKQLDENLIGDEHGDAADGLLLTDDEEDEEEHHHHHHHHHHQPDQDQHQHQHHRVRSSGSAVTGGGSGATKRRNVSSSSKGSTWSSFAALDDHDNFDPRNSSLSSTGSTSSDKRRVGSAMKRGRVDRCFDRLSAWWQEIRPVVRSVGFWALKQSYLLCLCGVYVAGLHQVNILNSVYLLILILFLTSPRIARQWWLFLVLYCETVILVVYTWSATPWTANIHSPKLLSMIGLQSYATTDLLFTRGLVWHLVIMLFAVIQLWVLRYTAQLTSHGQDRPTEKIPRWMRAIGESIFWLWDEYGLIPVYTVLVFVGSRDGKISFINIMYITLLFVCLTIHMLTRRADVHIKRFWIFVVVASGVILLARYAYQFPFIQEFLASVMPVEAINALGFIIFPSGAVFAPLLGNTFVFLVAVIQLQTFFAKKQAPVGVGHNAFARRLATESDFEGSLFENDQASYTDYSDYESSASSRPSSLPGSFKYGRDIHGGGGGGLGDEMDMEEDSLVVPLGLGSSSSSSSSRVNAGGGAPRSASDIPPAFSADEARLLMERGSSAKSERTVSAAQHLLMDEELISEDVAKHPTSSLRARKRRLRRKHFCETFLYTRALDLIYWFKRFFMLHAYKVAAIIMISIAVHSPSGLNSIFVEIAILSVSADHLTDGVGLLLLIYSQIAVLFMLIYQFQVVHDGLSAYQPLISWAGFEYLPDNRFSLIGTKMTIIIALLVQRFSHRWKNDWYRVKKIEIEHELEPPNPLNSDIFYAELMAKHHPYVPPSELLDHSTSASSLSAEAESKQRIEEIATSRSTDDTKYGILQQLKHLMQEDDRDGEAIEQLKLRYLHKTELTLFLYDSSEHLVMESEFSWREAWNLIAWFLSNILLIGGYPVFVGAILIAIFVHKETVYGVIFLLLLGLTIVTRRARWSSDGVPVKIVTVYVAVVLLLQYVLNLDLPPPDLRYPWSTWNPEWLAWLGLKQSTPHSTILIADFVLLLVLARIRRITSENLKEIHWSRYWYYLVGPVITMKESKTWRDSLRYAVYRFSPFVILLLVFIAGTIHPDILSFIYVFFALLFIFRESTIYSQRNKIWRFARLYNFLLLLIIILYQIPAIKPKPTGPMSIASIIGLRKFSDGGSILFSIFIFLLLGIQKRLFSRVEFDELVLNILDEEEKGVRLAQERFQEWKMERRQEFQRVQEQKRQRRTQLDFLKAARHRQQKLWQRLAGGAAGEAGNRTSVSLSDPTGGVPIGPTAAASTAPTKVDASTSSTSSSTANVAQLQQQQAAMMLMMAGGNAAFPPVPYVQHPYPTPSPYGDYMNDPRMRTMSTTHDLKMLQSAGGLSIEEDPTSHSVRLKFKSTPSSLKLPSSSTTTTLASPSTSTTTSSPVASSSSEQQQQPSTTTTTKPASLSSTGDSKDDLSVVIVHTRDEDDESAADGNDEEDGDEIGGGFGKPGRKSNEDDDEDNTFDDDEEDVLASALQQPRSSLQEEDDALEVPACCRGCWKTPSWVLSASDVIIGWLDKHTDGYLSTKPHYSRKRKVWAGFYKMYQINSSALCYLFFLINCAVNSDLISLFYPIGMFLYALLETPRPHKLYWNTVFVYAALTILVKFFYQISIFCVCHTGNGNLEWALASRCSADPTCFSIDKKQPISRGTQGGASSAIASSFHFSGPRVVGITSYSQQQGGNGGTFIVHIVPDVLVLISVFLHRYWLKKLGYWNFLQRLTLSKEGSDEPMSQRQLHEEAKRFEGILLKQQKKREHWTRYAAQKKKQRYAKRMKALSQSAGTSSAFEQDQQLHRQQYHMDPEEKYIENDDTISEDPEKGLARFGGGATGLSIVSNPLFKVGESDLETDSEEMSTTRSPSVGGGAGGGRHVRFGEEVTSFASALIPDISTSTNKKPSSSSSSSSSSQPTTTNISSILGATVGEQAKKRRVESSSSAPHSSAMESDTEETITIGRRPLTDSSDDEEENGEESTSSSDAGSSSSSSVDSDLYDYEEENLYADNRGLRRKRAINNFKRYMKARWNDFSNFFQNLVANKPGRDYYVAMWFVELICFFFIILLPTPFIGNSAGNVAEFLTQSRLPNSYVLTLLVQFILIVIERVLYLFRAIKIKVIYHCLLVAFYHVWLLFIIPIMTGEDFRSQPKLITFYLIKLFYLCLSSLQIMHGYPAFVQGQFLTDSEEPGILRWLIYTAYRAIPFVYELRTLLDWTVTKTSLTFFEWLKLEDIYANLFLVKCRVSQDKVWKRNVGDAQAWYVKLGMGVLLFVGLSALIWFPLLLLMQGSPGNKDNPIVAASISIGFTGYATPIFTGVAVQSNMKTGQDMGSALFNKLRVDQPAITYDDYSLLQWIEFENFSDASWTISPPAKQHLLVDLAQHPQSTMSIHLTFTRTFPISTGTVAELDLIAQINNPYDIIRAINGSHGNFSLPNIIPRYYRIPNSGGATPLNTDRPLGATFELSSRSELYWNCFGIPTAGPFPWDNSGRLQLVTFSAEAPTGIFRSLASVGLIGLYVGVVLAVARFLRLAITDLAFRIIYEDMPACEEIISYCEDIYMARQDGDLVLEEELFRELVEIYRSPETIIGRTIRTHPRFAGRELTEKEKRRMAKEDPQLLSQLEEKHHKQD